MKVLLAGVCSFSLLVFFVVSACGKGADNYGSLGDADRSGEGSDIRLASRSCPSTGSCSGDECCGEDKRCEDQCTNLFRGPAASRCKEEYSKSVIDKMYDMFVRPTNLDDLLKTEEEVFCSFFDINAEAWQNTAKKYTANHAKNIVQWIFTKDILAYISDEENRDETEMKTDLLERLLSTIGNGGAGPVNDANTLNGLTAENIERDQKTIFYMAREDDGANKQNFRFVHEQIIEDKICDKSGNSPRPSGYQAGSEEDAAEGYDMEACVLAVYCKAGPGDEDKSDRERAADVLKDNRITNFIEAEKVNGGLGVESRANKWPVEACTALRNLWSNSGLDLGLGS